MMFTGHTNVPSIIRFPFAATPMTAFIFMTEHHIKTFTLVLGFVTSALMLVIALFLRPKSLLEPSRESRFDA